MWIFDNKLRAGQNLWTQTSVFLQSKFEWFTAKTLVLVLGVCDIDKK